MPFVLPNLPYKESDLEPYVSGETVNYHYDKHNRAYVNNLNKLIVNTEFESKTLEEIVKTSSGGIFNNAAQMWNHKFYWQCMTKEHNQDPSKGLHDRIKDCFGNMESMILEFKNKAVANFGSGWTWLVVNPDGSLEILNTSNAHNPLTSEKSVLIACDVWEHAYYIDTRNDRAKYLDNFFKIVSWEFASANFNKANIDN